MERLSIDEVMAHCRRTCEHTEMLAIAQGKTQDDITSNNYWEHYQVEEWLKELKAYRDAEEQGLLLRLPFATGTPIYKVVYSSKINDGFIYETTMSLKYYADDIKAFEKGLVYSDKEEAEQKLAEMGGVGYENWRITRALR